MTEEAKEEQPKLNVHKLIILIAVVAVILLLGAGGVRFHLLNGTSAEDEPNVLALHPDAIILPDQANTDHYVAPVTYNIPHSVGDVASWYRSELTTAGYAFIFDEVDTINGGGMQFSNEVLSLELQFWPVDEQTSQFSLFLFNQEPAEDSPQEDPGPVVREISPPIAGENDLSFLYHPDAVQVSEESDIYASQVEYRVASTLDEVRGWYDTTLTNNGYMSLIEDDTFLVFENESLAIEISLWMPDETSETTHFTLYTYQLEPSETVVFDDAVADSPTPTSIEGETDLKAELIGPDAIYAGTMQRFAYQISLQGTGVHTLTITLPPTQVMLLEQDRFAYIPQDQSIVVQTDSLNPEQPYLLDIPVMTNLLAKPSTMAFKVLAQDSRGELHLDVVRLETR